MGRTAIDVISKTVKCKAEPRPGGSGFLNGRDQPKVSSANWLGTLGFGRSARSRAANHGVRRNAKAHGEINRSPWLPNNHSLPVAARFLLPLFVCGLLALRALASAGMDAGKALLDRGDYKNAIAELTKVLAQTPDNPEALAALLQAETETGDYRKALEQGEEFLKRAANPAVAEQTAEAAFRIGEYERAAELLNKVSTPQADWLKGLLADHKGDQESARASFERLAGLLTQRQRLTSEDRDLAASALSELGRVKEANQEFHGATQNDPKNASLKVDWGSLMARKHNPADAEALFREALEINPHDTGAMVGMGELAADRFEGQASDWIKRALEVNPNLAEAHLLSARMALEQDDYPTAEAQLDQVLKGNPRLLEGWSLRAALEYLKDNAAGEQDWVSRILKENPYYGKVFLDLGGYSAEKRQLEPAVEFYRRALATDSGLDEARSELGINLFRLGKEDEARKVLEEAYGKDPYNVSTVNTLRLMESFSHFDTFETQHFAVKLHKKESAILRPYVSDLLEKTIEDLTARYGFVPPQKTTFEMYPDHEDFAVRTVGMPGLGALGATIGNVVAMDSPSGRPLGTFHWGSTLWHEVTHVISLGMTSGRVPRWFTEGLSVYEETQARPGWGDPMDIETIQALKEHQLLPLQDLNGAFIHPKFRDQVPYAYFQSGMICQYIAEKYGFPKILVILHSYAQGRHDAEAIQDALGKTMAEFDADFLKYAKEQTYGFAEAIDLQWANPDRKEQEFRDEVQKHPGNYFAHLYLAAALAKGSNKEEAITQAQAAKDLFPLYIGHGNPYRILADIYEGMGQKAKAVAELQLWKNMKGRDPETFKKLASLQAELGQTADAIQTLQAATYISMFDVDIHNHLGDWLLQNSNPQAAVTEYQAVLALGTADQAGAHYNLANAYRALADNRNARMEVLAALEIAPGFRPAQKLLLELSGK